MSLINKLQNNDQPAAKAGNKSYNTFGLVLEVETAKEVNGELRLTGKAINSNSHVQSGEPLSIAFRGDAARSVTNFDKGNGKSWRKNEASCAGSIVTLESCYITKETEADRKVVSARWLNTLRNVHNPDHADRSSLEGVLALAPRVYFDNPQVGPNEPTRFALPVVGEKFSGRVKTEHGTFKREFPAELGIEKLKALPGDAKLRVQLDIIEPREAQKVTSKDELVAALSQQLARGTEAFSMLRAGDGDQVITRTVHVSFKKDGDNYVPDVENALKDLFSNNLFAGVKDTDALFQAAAAGELTMEAVPGYRLSFAGNAAQDDNASYKMISDLKQGRTQRFEMIFGSEPDRFAPVILPGMMRGDGESISAFQPVNLIGDEHGTFSATDFPSPYIATKAAPKAAAVPQEDADPAQSRTPADLADRFDSELQEPADEPASALTP
ncbi:MAG: hypothetical protein ACREPQ_00460 [Rhodanobacter sp.]